MSWLWKRRRRKSQKVKNLDKHAITLFTAKAHKKLTVLSFGDEADEDEKSSIAVNKEIKQKSAHDVISDDAQMAKEEFKPEGTGFWSCVSKSLILKDVYKEAVNNQVI